MAPGLRLASSSALRASSLLSKAPRALGLRHLHKRKPLPYPVEGGLGNFLPPPALETLVEYQDGLLERLNEETRSDPQLERHSTVAQTVVNYATRKERTLGFNYAVLALNNSFFLEQLAPPPEHGERHDHQDKMSLKLVEAIRTHYGDITKLKSTFSATALGMFSNGWVWMVSDANGNLGVLPTFGPSTLLIRSRRNMNPEKLIFREEVSSEPTPSPFASSVSKAPPPGTTPSLPTSGVSGFPQTAVPPDARQIHTGSVASVFDAPASRTESRGAKIPELLSAGKVLYPLFCIPVYEHGWMSAGYGIWGKEAWLKEFWPVLDWSKVSKLYDHAVAPKSPTF